MWSLNAGDRAGRVFLIAEAARVQINNYKTSVNYVSPFFVRLTRIEIKSREFCREALLILSS